MSASQAKLREAISLHQQGQLAAAKIVCEQVLAQQPNDADALHLLGDIALQTNNPQDAVELFNRAINSNPQQATFYTNRGLALHALERWDEAADSYDRAIAIKPDYASAYINRGNTLQVLGRWDEAIDSYSCAIALKPDFAEAYFNRGNTLQALKRWQEAVEDFDCAIALKPTLADAYLNRGNSLQELMELEQALVSYDHAIAINPHYADAHFNRGNVLKKLYRTEEAVESFDRAIALKPDFASAYSNRGLVLAELKKWQAASENFDRAIALNHHYADFHQNKALMLLATKNFAQGWDLYEWRSKLEKAILHPINIETPWDGKKMMGSLLVLPEQGLGDEIFYAGMLNDLPALVGNVTVCVDPRLIPLYERSFEHIDFISKDLPVNVQDFDAQIYMGSLGRFFRADEQAVIDNVKSPYLTADYEKTKKLRKHLSGNKKLICGLSWVSNNADFGAEKTLSLHDLNSILSLDNIDFVNLQYGDTSEEQAAFYAETGIKLTQVPEIDNLNDIDGLASLINACDIVLTISNTTAHLASALGKTAIVMLPYARGLFWYWHDGHSNNPWYPTARLCRQPKTGDWQSVISEAKLTLVAEANKR